MLFFGKKTKELETKIEVVEKNIVTSFSRVRDDLSTQNAWLNYYYQKSIYLERVLQYVQAIVEKKDERVDVLAEDLRQGQENISKVEHTLDNVRKDLISVQDRSEQFIDKNRLNFYIEKISKEISLVDSRIQDISFFKTRFDSLKNELESHMKIPHLNPSVEKRIDEIQEKLRSIVVKKSPKDKLVQKVQKNNHDYIKAMVLSYVKKYEKVSAYQLREMVVEEQNITSKSTFYRILEELEERDDISTIRQGKEKVYLAKLRKTA